MILAIINEMIKTIRQRIRAMAIKRTLGRYFTTVQCEISYFLRNPIITISNMTINRRNSKATYQDRESQTATIKTRGRITSIKRKNQCVFIMFLKNLIDAHPGSLMKSVLKVLNNK